MSPDDEIRAHLSTLHLDGTFLELGPKEEAFFKAETGIQDTEELRKHIIEVQEEAYKVSSWSRADWVHLYGEITLRSASRSTHTLAFVGLDSRVSSSQGCLHIHASSSWRRTAQMRYFWILDAAVRTSSYLGVCLDDLTNIFTLV